MESDALTLWLQFSAVIVAIAASITALVISALDRRNSRRIAAKDREVAIRQAKLMFEMEALLRLAQNLRRGGHSDRAISKDMGAEASALIGALGPTRLPMNWIDAVGGEEDLREHMADEKAESWRRKSIEAQLALNATAAELQRLMESQTKP